MIKFVATTFLLLAGALYVYSQPQVLSAVQAGCTQYGDLLQQGATKALAAKDAAIHAPVGYVPQDRRPAAQAQASAQPHRQAQAQRQTQRQPARHAKSLLGDDL